MIANSGSDEYGRYSGGSAGDQTGKEWRIINWYNRPWNCVLRHPDSKVRDFIATLAEQGANNNNIGYDQYERWTFWEQLKKVGYYPVSIKTKCEADCSAGVISITWAVGYLLGLYKLKQLNATYTGNMRSGFRSAGFEVLTESKYLNSDSYLMRGDILLNDAHHTAINLTTGNKVVVEEDDMTEAEVRKIVGEELQSTLVSSGCTPSSWATKIWEKATNLGLVTPKKNSKEKLGERPLGYAKREEVVTIVMKAMDIMEDDGK